MNGADGSSATVSVHVSNNARVICHTYKLTTPILVVSTGAASVCISVTGRESMPASAVKFARELAQDAQRFASECERLHALYEKASGDGSTPAQAGVIAGEKP